MTPAFSLTNCFHLHFQLLITSLGSRCSNCNWHVQVADGNFAEVAAVNSKTQWQPLTQYARQNPKPSNYAFFSARVAMFCVALRRGASPVLLTRQITRSRRKQLDPVSQPKTRRRHDDVTSLPLLYGTSHQEVESRPPFLVAGGALNSSFC